MMRNPPDHHAQSLDRIVLSWDFFENLPREREEFYKISHRRKLKRKENLFFEGDFTNSIFYVLEGKIMLTRLSRSGREVVLYVHKKGAFVGLPSALAGFPLRMNAQSLTHSIVYETGYNDFKSLMSRFPVLFERVMFQLYVTLGIISEQYLSAFSDDAEIRLKKLLVRLFSDELLRPGVDKRPNRVILNLTQDQLAAAIGTSRPMVNKILRRMMANGIISISSHKISFLKPDKLLSYLDLAPANRVV